MKRIHIVGCGPRSGTTLLTELMSTCFEIDLFTEHEDSIFKLPPKKCDIYLTKNPSDILHAKTVLNAMANLHVIYMIRDPRDMVVSRHNSDPSRYWSGLIFWKTYTPYGRALTDHPRFISIRYEDLVIKPDQVQADLMARFPFLKKKANFSDYHVLAKPSERSLKALREVRPVSSSSIGNWRNHLPRIAGQIQLHGSINDDLIFYGYEKDSDWEKLLENIEPDLNPSHWSEFQQIDSNANKPWLYYIKAAYANLAHSRFHGLVLFTNKSYRWIRRCSRMISKHLKKFLTSILISMRPAYIPVVAQPCEKPPLSRRLIIKPGMLAGDDGANINVPSIIRVPDWIEAPLGRYYLYFSCHSGCRYIRLAVADHIEGPWRIHLKGVLHAIEIPMIGDYVYSPDVHVDEENNQIRMYFHAARAERKKPHVFVATSKDGMDFDVLTDLAQTFYFRAFPYQGAWYGLSKGGRLFRSKDGLSTFMPGPDLFPIVPGNNATYGMAGSIRHVSIEVFSSHAEIYYTRIGDAPEIILKSHIDLSADWQKWRAEPPIEVMRSEQEWEGAHLPIEASRYGKTIQPAHQLRDPEIFRDSDGARYLLYAAAGEHGIGLARLD